MPRDRGPGGEVHLGTERVVRLGQVDRAPMRVPHVEPVVVTADRDARRPVKDVGVGRVEQVALRDRAAEQRLVQRMDRGAPVIAGLGQQLPVLRALAGDVDPPDARPIVVLDAVAEPLEVLVLGQPSRLVERPVVGAEDGLVAHVAPEHLRLRPCGGPGQAVVARTDPEREAVPGCGRHDRVVGRWSAIEVDVGEGVRVGALELHLDARPVDGFARRLVHPAVPVPQERAAEAIVDGGRCAMHPDRSPDRQRKAQPPSQADARTPPPAQGTR